MRRGFFSVVLGVLVLGLVSFLPTTKVAAAFVCPLQTNPGTYPVSFSGKVTGSSLSAPTQVPLVKASVIVNLPNGNQLSAVTDVNGNYTINTNLDDKGVQIWARVKFSAIGYWPEVNNYDVNPTVNNGTTKFTFNRNLTVVDAKKYLGVGGKVSVSTNVGGTVQGFGTLPTGVTVTAYRWGDNARSKVLGSASVLSGGDPLSSGTFELDLSASGVAVGDAVILDVLQDGVQAGVGVKTNVQIITRAFEPITNIFRGYGPDRSATYGNVDVEGRVVSSNGLGFSPGAAMRMVQGSLTFGGGPNNTDGSFGFVNQYPVVPPIPSAPITIFKPGSALLQMSYNGNWGPADIVWSRTISIGPGRNVLTLSPNFSLVCGQVTLDKTSILLPSAPIGINDKSGHTASMVTDLKGNYRSYQVYSGSSGSNYTPTGLPTRTIVSAAKDAAGQSHWTTLLPGASSFASHLDTPEAKVASPVYNIMRNISLPENLAQGFNNIPAPIDVGKGNMISGTITIPGGIGTPSFNYAGYQIRLSSANADGSINAFLDNAMTDEFGKFHLQSLNYKKGNYVLQAWTVGQNPISVGPTSAFTFKTDLDEIQTATVAVTTPQNPQYVVAVQASTSDPRTDAAAPVADATITLDQQDASYNPTGQQFSATTDVNGSATFVQIPTGAYYVSGIAPGKVGATKIFVRLVEKSSGIGFPATVTLSLIPTINPGPCVNKPQATMKDFWICDQTIPDSFLSAVDSKITSLRSQFAPRFNTLPLMMTDHEITKSDVLNAAFSPRKNCTSLDLSTTPPTGEQIELSSSYLKFFNLTNPADISSLLAVVTHEFGHGVDWHRGSCLVFDSDSGTFADLRALGKTYGNSFFSVLKEGNYDSNNPTSGHPQASNTETMASAFNDMISYQAAFQSAINKINLPTGLAATSVLQSLLRQVASYAVQ